MYADFTRHSSPDDLWEVWETPWSPRCRQKPSLLQPYKSLYDGTRKVCLQLADVKSRDETCCRQYLKSARILRAIGIMLIGNACNGRPGVRNSVFESWRYSTLRTCLLELLLVSKILRVASWLTRSGIANELRSQSTPFQSMQEKSKLLQSIHRTF